MATIFQPNGQYDPFNGHGNGLAKRIETAIGGTPQFQILKDGRCVITRKDSEGLKSNERLEGLLGIEVKGPAILTHSMTPAFKRLYSVKEQVE